MREAMKVPSRIEIPPFPQGKRIAVTTSWDDGHVHDRKIVAAFNEWGLKGTFNLCSGALTKTGSPAPEGARNHLDISEVASLYEGHEVAVHTVNHPHLPLLDASQAAFQVLEDRKALEDIVGYPVRGMAYPFGTFSPQVIDLLRSLGIVYCRTTQNAACCFPPADPLVWATTAHQYASDPTVPERFQQIYDNPRHTGVFFVWGHGFEFHDRGWNTMEPLFKPLSGKPDIWYCTNIQLFDYEDARKRMIVGANRAFAYNPSALAVTLRVDGELVEVAGGQTVRLAS